jgi:chorismate mutase
MTDPGLDTPSSKGINFFKEAFHIQYNVIGLAAAGAFALVSASFLPVLLAAGAELMYLATVPNNKRFQRLVRSWYLAKEKQQTQQSLTELLRHLPADLQGRYVKLAEICGGIRANFGQLSSNSQIFVQQMDSRLEGLLHGYARLLQAAHQQRQYVKSVDPQNIKNEIATLQRKLDTDPPKVQEIDKKRIEILCKRLDKFQKIAENRQVVDAQIAAMEDVLQLVRDQSITMRDPQQVSDQLENLVHDVEQTEETVKQMEAIFSNLPAEMSGVMAMADEAGTNSTGANRTRIRT